MMKKAWNILLLFLLPASVTFAQNNMDAARTKAWWFFGDTVVTHAGITADLKAFKRAGLGGVVYYDQIHGKGTAAPLAFSPQWWSDLKFAALGARKAGLSFEVNISNGYVAGGPWITPQLGMQMVMHNEIFVNGGSSVKAYLPRPARALADVALLAFPDEMTGHYQMADCYVDCGSMATVRSITYNLKASSKGKARTSSMNLPGAPASEFYGTNYQHIDPPCQLECSADGKSWRAVCALSPVRQAMSSWTTEQTLSFPPVNARYFRIAGAAPDFKSSDVRSAWLSERRLVDGWQKKAAYHSDYIDSVETCGETDCAIDTASVIDLSSCMQQDDTLRCTLPQGKWRILRICYGPTMRTIKHGRPGLSGLECDNLSAEAVTVQWNHYFAPICDTLAAIGCKPQGVVVDSHEAGPQNWTPGFAEHFLALRGYAMRKFLPAVCGYVVGSKAETEQFLYDYRRTIADLISRNFFGTLDSLARKAHVCLTAQAIGNSLSIVGDNLQAKGQVMKPQGEFWTYQKDGNYDVKEASSAAHLYGRNIASAEAFTDATYQTTLPDLKKIADMAFVFGINEFVVCAIPHQPWTKPHDGYAAGNREYAINRGNKWWDGSRPFWDYQARTAALLREGKPVADVCVFLGGNCPVKILSYRLPEIPDGFDFDACTSDALGMMTAGAQQRAVMPCGMSYRMVALQRDCSLTASDLQRLATLVENGVPLYGSRPACCASGDVDVFRTLVTNLWGDGTAQSGVNSYGKGHVYWGMDLKTALAKEGITADCEFHREPRSHNHVYDDRLYFIHRAAEHKDAYFIVNHSPQPYSGTVSFRSSKPIATMLDPMTGKTSKADAVHTATGTDVSLNLQPDESRFVLFTDK